MLPKGEYTEPKPATNGDFQVCFVLLVKIKTLAANWKPTMPCPTQSFKQTISMTFQTSWKADEP